MLDETIECTEPVESNVVIDQVDKNPETNLDWKNLLAITEAIKTKDVRDFTLEFLCTEVPDYFARIPASASGKYHPEYAAGYAGLVRHTIAVTTFAHCIIQLDYLRLSRMDKDCILAACILHDTFKQGVNESGTTIRRHPEVAAKAIMEFGKKKGQEQLGTVIAGLVVSHMGVYGDHKPGNRGQFLVHLADYLASRNYISISWDSLLNDFDRR